MKLTTITFIYTSCEMEVHMYTYVYIQWNLSKTDAIGTEPCVHYMEGVRGFCFKFKFIDRDILHTIAPAVSHFLKRKPRLKLLELLLIVAQDMAWKSLANIDFMAHKTTLIDSENLSCRRNRIAIFS